MPLSARLKKSPQAKKTTPPIDRKKFFLKKIKAYVELSKLQITRTVVITAGIGYYVAEKTKSSPKLNSNFLGFNLDKNFIADFQPSTQSSFNWIHFSTTLFAIALVCAASCSFNHILETSSDAKMKRTKNRPILSGAVSRWEAIVFGIVVGLFGLYILAETVSPFVSFCAFATLCLYDFIYTPMKKLTAWNTSVGAIPGALPIVAGYIAGMGGSVLTSIVLFMILFVWQHPHFYAIAWIYRKDYASAGYKMISFEDESGQRTFLASLVSSVVLTFFSIILATSAPGLGGLYVATMLATCVGFSTLVWKAYKHTTTRNARNIVIASVAFFPIWFIAIALDLTLF